MVVVVVVVVVFDYDDYFSTDRSATQIAHHHSPSHSKWMNWVSMDKTSQFQMAMCSADSRGKE